jgi:hypothetical protein
MRWKAGPSLELITRRWYEASLDIYLAAQHLAARGMAVARIDKATRVLSGHCRRDALEKLCEVSGVARIEQRGKLPMSAGKSRGS